MKSSTSAISANDALLKGVALFQLGLALVRLVIERGSWPSVSMMVTGALLMVFCAREKVNDERVDHLKLKAAKAGLLGGTLIVMLAQVVVTTFRPGQSQPERGSIPGVALPFSAFDALGLVMLIALGCYYYWRWQDGRLPEPSDGAGSSSI